METHLKKAKVCENERKKRFLNLLQIWVLFIVCFLFQNSFENLLYASILSSPIKNLIFAPVQTGRLHNAHPWSDVSIIQSNWIKLSIWLSRLICHMSIADLCLRHCKCFLWHLLCLLCCCWWHMALSRPEYQDHNFDVSLTPAKGFFAFSDSWNSKMKAILFGQPSCSYFSMCARLYSLIQEWPLLIWVMSMVENLDITLHQPLCMYYAQEKPTHSSFLNQSHYV